jgi:hypothetical protein
MTDRYRGNLLLSEDLDTFIIQFIQFLTTEDPTITLTDANGNPIPVSSLSQVLGNSVAPSAVLAVAQDASDALSAAATASGVAVAAASLGASAYDLASSASSAAAEALEELATNGPIVSGLQATATGMAVTIAAVSAVADAATGSAASAGAAALSASGLAVQAESNALIASGLAITANANALVASGVGETALTAAQGASGYANTAYSEALSAYALAGSALALAEGAATSQSVTTVRTTAAGAASTAASALSVAETALSEASSALSILSSGVGGGGAATLPIEPANGGTVIQYPGGAYVASDATGTTLVTNDFFASDTVTVSGEGASLSVYTNSASSAALYIGNSSGTNIMFVGMGAHDDTDPMAYIENAGGLTIGSSGNNLGLVLDALGNTNINGALHASAGAYVTGGITMPNGSTIAWASGTGINVGPGGAAMTISSTSTAAYATILAINNGTAAHVAVVDGVGNWYFGGSINYTGNPFTGTGAVNLNLVNGSTISWSPAGSGMPSTAAAGASLNVGAGGLTISASVPSTSSKIFSWQLGGVEQHWLSATTLRINGLINVTGAGSIINSGNASTALMVQTAGASYTLGITDTGANGAGIGFFGNGTTTPNKYLRAAGGGLQLVNSAYSGVVATFDDVGNLTMAAGVTATAFHAGYNSGTGGSVDASQWFRSSGQTGWYSASYGGGIYCIDGTYVRAYSNFQMYAADFVLSSDRRLKTAIRDFEYNGRLRPVSFFHLEKGHDDLGFISQEVQELYPELVGADPENGMLLLSYPKITTILSAQLNLLEDRVAARDKVIDDLIAQLNNTPWKRFSRFIKGLFSRKGKVS